MTEGIALLSAYGDADSDIDDLDDSPVKAPVDDAVGSIVDYAHDEGHADDVRADEAVLGDKAAVEVSESPGVESDGIAPMEAEEVDEQEDAKVQETSENGVEAPVPSAEEEDILANFWPSPPSTACSEGLQAKFAKFLKYKAQGRNFNDDLRLSKGYRNPDFLQLAVMHQNIDDIGSCFDPEVFHPHGYDRSDFADALAAEQRREADRKEHERRQNQRSSVDFVRATQLLTSQKAVATNARLTEGAHNIISTVHTTTTTTEVRSETRTNKKSKWDKAGHH